MGSGQIEADFVIEDWPTSGGSSLISGELKWPVEHYRYDFGNIPWAHPNTEILAASVSNRYLDINNKLYEKTDYVGLRGVFKNISINQQREKWEDVRSLRRYVLWRWNGYAPGIAETQADVDELAELDREFRNTAAGEAAEKKLTDRRWMYFYDGLSQDAQGNPVMTAYYIDGQGLSSSNEGKVDTDFYQMIHMGSGLSGPDAQGTDSFSGGGASNAADEILLSWADRTNTYEYAAGGIAATETAYQAVYADVLAWNRLVADSNITNEAHVEPLLSYYKTIRENMMNTAGSVLTSSLGVLGGQFMNPDMSQSLIRQNIESRLRETYSDAWVDFFMTKENVGTITPEGFQDFGWDQDARPIPAGTPAGQIQGRNTPHGWTGAQAMNSLNSSAYYGLGGGSTVTLENMTVVGSDFALNNAGHAGISGYGASDPNHAQLVQRYPRDFDLPGYSLRTLGSALELSDIFVFPYTPNDIQYQALGAKWVEVPRTGDLPLLEFSQWTLMKVSMEFVVANMVVENNTPYPDGLRTSIYDQLEQLRTMAQRPFPVEVFGLDQMLRVSMKRAEITGKPLEFVIGDMSVSSIQRTIQEGNKEITSARVKMTLQEIPIEESLIHHFRLPIVVPNITPPDEDQGSSGRVLVVRTPGGVLANAEVRLDDETTASRVNPGVFDLNASTEAQPRTPDTYPQYEEWGIYGSD